MATRYPVSGEQFVRENQELRAKLAEAEQRLADTRQRRDVAAPDAHAELGFALKRAEDDLRTLLEAINEGAANLDAGGTVLYANQRLSDLLGIRLEHIFGQPIASFVAHAERAAFEQLLVKARSGQPARGEVQLQSGSGSLIPFRVSFQKIKSAQPASLCMVLTDLTEHKKRDELIAAGRLSGLILDSAAEAIAVCDQAGTIIAGNDALHRLCGGNPLFRPFDVALPLELIENNGSSPKLFSIADALSGGTLRAQEVQIVRPELAATLLLTSAPINEESGVVGCVLTMTDVTDRKSSEEALRESEERLRLFIEYAPVALAMFDSEMRYLYASRRWRSDFGIALDELR